MSDEGDASLVQYDCPESVLLVNGRVVEPEKKWREVNDKKIFEAKFRMKPGDMLVMFSDGVIHAGVGMLMNLGWQREKRGQIRRTGVPEEHVGHRDGAPTAGGVRQPVHAKAGRRHHGGGSAAARSHAGVRDGGATGRPRKTTSAWWAN